MDSYLHLLSAYEKPNPGIYLSAAKLMSAQGTQGSKRALALLDRGIEDLGPLPPLQNLAIELELASGREEAALARLESMGQILGHGPHWQVEMAEMLLRLNQRERARAMALDASMQLQTLRPTPARRKLALRAAALSQPLDSP